MIISLICLPQLLCACASAEKSTAVQTTNPNSSDQDSSDKSNQSSAVATASADSSGQVLSIGSGCTGCGHCVRFDPEHFSYRSGRIPAVISQSNLDSSSLSLAINRCRARAIVLEG